MRHNIRQLAKENNLPEKSLNKRLKRGLTLQHAIMRNENNYVNKPFRCLTCSDGTANLKRICTICLNKKNPPS